MSTADFNYYEKLKSDLAEQFKEKSNIDDLMQVIATQLQDVWQFLSDMIVNRMLDNATGLQLDMLGESVGITRDEALQMAEGAGAVFDTEDDLYRAYIKYKISMNSSDGSYSNIMSSIHAQWAGETQYSEEPADPATIILNVDRFRGQDIASLVNVPISKPAGVGIRFRTKVRESSMIYIGVSMVQRRSLTFVVGE